MCMSYWFGGTGGSGGNSWDSGLSSPPWRLYLNLADLVDPVPSMTLLLWDERGDTINTGSFWVDMTGFPDQPQLTQFTGDMPASYHNHAGGLALADGHAEIKVWKDPRTFPPLGTVSDLNANESPNNQDIIWLQNRATRLIQTSVP